jgi:hypothetical protein
MLNDSSQNKEYIEDVSKAIVSDVAPEELDLFDELVAEYYEDPTPPDLSEKDVDDELAFGIGEMLIPVTPAAAAMVTTVLNFLLTEVIKVVKEENGKTIKEIISDFIRPEKSDKEELEPLTVEQLKQIRRIARKQARSFGMDPDIAKKMAESLIGALALTS